MTIYSADSRSGPGLAAPVRWVAAAALALLAPLAAASEAVPAGALAPADVPAFLDKARCIACHGATDRRVGPPWVAIASRYRNADGEQVGALAAKIRLGGAGNWGLVPMAANPQVSDAQARAVVQWLQALDVGKLPQ
ncbi:MAG: c-type cytochrome [Nevskia sp.]|nr:c-type cytochrome [Nevskia sp.]